MMIKSKKNSNDHTTPIAAAAYPQCCNKHRLFHVQLDSVTQTYQTTAHNRNSSFCASASASAECPADNHLGNEGYT